MLIRIIGIAPYAGALNSTWWDRDLGIGGRVFVKDSKSGKIEMKLVKLDWPSKSASIIASFPICHQRVPRLLRGTLVHHSSRLKPHAVAPGGPPEGHLAFSPLFRDEPPAALRGPLRGAFIFQNETDSLLFPVARIPTLAPHFGTASSGPFNKETEMVPIIGLSSHSDNHSASTAPHTNTSLLSSSSSTFASTQPPLLLSAIASTLSIPTSSIFNWELELFDTQPACLGGISKELIFAGRIDDRLCSYSAIEGLLTSSTSSSSIIKSVALYDDEEIGSLLRQGAQSTLLPATISRVIGAFLPPHQTSEASLLAQTFANSFLISADVTHALNPNFMHVYLENHSPKLNVGVAIQADPNGHTTTDGASTALLMRVAQKAGCELQVFQIRNDVRSGGTVGPMLSSKTGMRSIDAGLPQLSMHSIRATTGSLDPGLGVKLFGGFFNHFESIDKEFR